MPNSGHHGSDGLMAGSPNWGARIRRVISEIEPLISLYPFQGYGNKRKLLPHILGLIPEGTTSMVDLFGGCQIVGWAAKRLGIRIISNDVLRYSVARASGLVANNGTTLSKDEMGSLLEPNCERDDYLGKFYRAAFNQPSLTFMRAWSGNVHKLDCELKRTLAAVAPVIVLHRRQKYGNLRLSPLGVPTSLDYLDIDLRAETVGLLTETLPLLLFDNGQPNEVHRSDAIDLLPGLQADVAYIDTPYQTNGGRYESDLATYDDYFRIASGEGHLVVNPYDEKADLEPYTRFDLRATAVEGFARLFRNSRHIPTLILSYNTTSGISVEEIETLARDCGRVVERISIPYSRPIVAENANDWTVEVLIVCRNRGAAL